MINPEQFQWREHNEIVLTPAFELVAATSAPLAKAAPGLIQFHEEFMRRYAKALTTYSTGTMTSWRKPNSKIFQMVPAWFAEPRNLAKGDFSITFHSGADVVELMPPALSMSFENGMSYGSAILPLDTVATNASLALDLVQNMVSSRFALSAGWGGYGIALNERMGPLQGDPKTKIRAWLKRHPGFGHGCHFAVSDRAMHGISNANWLTLLGPELTAKKGGKAAIATALAAHSPEILVHPLGDGVCIQAGPLPQIGDVDRGDDLPLYRAVGRYLKDIRSTEPPRFLFGFHEDSEAWFARFDE